MTDVAPMIDVAPMADVAPMVDIALIADAVEVEGDVVFVSGVSPDEVEEVKPVPDPPAASDSCAKPIEGGSERYTE